MIIVLALLVPASMLLVAFGAVAIGQARETRR